MNQTTGYISEIFCSIQGEGIYVGDRQVFVRTAGCSATCYWCDTLASKNKSNICVIHAGERRTLRNPLSVSLTIDALRDVIRDNEPVRTVSFTGGEPLEQPEFVSELARFVKRDGLRTY
ncbi:MAG: 7-carboxy-7-deazaguanine synthase QueE, partial [Candidatus Latescibacterota bacterium]